MDNELYLPRLIDSQLDEYLDEFGAVCVEGPKWCGKTWTCKNRAKSVFEVADPKGNFQNRTLAQMDPSIILKGDFPRLIDEWQEVPSIWDAVRFSVDENPQSGLYLLSGSSTPKTKGYYHSGAGRISRLKMETMSLYESKDSSGLISLKDLLNNKPKPTLVDQVSLTDLANLIVVGGWPSQFRLNDRRKARNLAKEYIDSLINFDFNRNEDKTRDIEKAKRLLKSLARNESTTASIKLLKRDMTDMDGTGLDEETISDYLSVLKRMFVIEDQAAFSPNVRSSTRLKQAPKRHLCDPSIACALLNLTEEHLINDLKTFGFMFEALCERDLRIYCQNIGASLYHYQDYSGKEIDAVVSYNDGEWGAFEIKLGANQIDEAAINLIKIKNDFIKDENSTPPSFLCVICGLSNAAYTREDGVIVLPITALKP